MPVTTTTILDPTAERQPVHRPRAARLPSLDGVVVGLLDISKARGDVFADRLEERLADRGVQVRRYRKPTFSKPAPVDLRQQIAEQCGAVVEALADWGSCTSCSLHDIVDLEARGVVGVVVASSAFTDAAALQASSLGADPACVFVPHPIQDRTDAEVRALADDAVEAIVAALTTG